jgi:hypothetical protein
MSSTHGNGGWWFKPELGLLFLVVIKKFYKNRIDGSTCINLMGSYRHLDNLIMKKS